MVDPETCAFAPIAKQIAEDAGKLTDDEENWTDYSEHEVAALRCALAFLWRLVPS